MNLDFKVFQKFPKKIELNNEQIQTKKLFKCCYSKISTKKFIFL